MLEQIDLDYNVVDILLWLIPLGVILFVVWLLQYLPRPFLGWRWP